MRIVRHGSEVSDMFGALYGSNCDGQTERYDKLIGWFEKSFGGDGCYICSSSGRVEVIGNHTDHNGGKIVGCTVNLDIIAAFLPSDDGKVTIKSKGYKDISFTLDELEEIEIGSRGMAKGMLRGLKECGYAIGGFSACMTSDIASGAGISSSAAYELMIGQIVNALYNDGKVTPVELAKIGQYAENVYFNKPCGLLDQGVIAVGGIVFIDFKDGFSYRSVLSDLRDFDLVLVDTGGSHANLTEHYASIPREMKSVAAFFGKDRLIDVAPDVFFSDYDEVKKALGERPALRAKHFYKENCRVEITCRALENNDTSEFIKLINASGDSSLYQLQNCSYEGGDTLIPDAIALARQVCPSCASRVHGGGFAGTVLNIVPKAETRGFAEKMASVYGKDKVYRLSVRTVGTCVL